jgi:hypothetical protein
MHVEIYTDHKTLLNFDTQRDLSQRQAHWMEFLLQYDYSFHYIASTLNTAADALSQLPIVDSSPCDDHLMVAATFLSLSSSGPSSSPAVPQAISVASALRLDLDNTVLWDIQMAYRSDPFAIKVRETLKHRSSPSGMFEEHDGLIFFKDCLLIPKVAAL